MGAFHVGVKEESSNTKKMESSQDRGMMSYAYKVYFVICHFCTKVIIVVVRCSFVVDSMTHHVRVM
ncbi:hypothetical protein Hanom_Chr16g01464761 [Helianthus anomalus]